MRSSWIWLLAGLGVVAAWLLLARPSDAPLRSPTERATPAEVKAPTLAGAKAQAEPGAAASTSSPPTAESLTPVLPSVPTHVLTLTVRGGKAADEVAAVTITAARSDYRSVPPVTAPAHAEGSTEIDVSSLFTGSAAVLNLHVEVGHRDYVASAAVVPVPPAEPSEAQPRRFRAEIALRRVAVAVGRLVGPDGAALAGGKVAVVALDGATPRARPSDVQPTAADGTWRVRVGAPGRYVIVAVHADLHPASREVDLAPEHVVDAGELRLSEGVRVAGRVRFRGTPVPDARVELSRQAVGDEPILRLEPDVAWHEGRAVLSCAGAVTDASGRYVLAGLAAGTAQIRVADIPEPQLHVAFQETTERTVEVPATGIDFELDGIELVVDVTAADRPAPQTLISIGVEDMGHSSTSTSMGTSCVLPHGADVTITVEAEGSERSERTLTLPAEGLVHRETFELVPRRGRPGVVIELLVPDGQAIATSGIARFAADGGGWPEDHRDLDGEGNRFVFDAPHGRHVIRLRPGGPWFGGTAYWCADDVVVDVPAAGRAEVKVPLRKGGRLRIAARDADGRIVSARCSVRAGHGDALPVTFTQRTEQGMFSGTGRTYDGVVSSVDPALPAGTYTVALEASGHAARTVNAVVEAGKTLDLDVTLEPAR